MTPDTSPDQCQDLLSTHEAASHLGVSERHFRRRYAKVLASTPGPHGAAFYLRHDLDGIRSRTADTDAAPADLTPARTSDLSWQSVALTLAGQVQQERAHADAATQRAIELAQEVGRLQAELAALRAVPKRPWWRWW